MRQHHLFIVLLAGLLILLCALCACGDAQAPIPIQTSANTNAQESSASINTDTDPSPKGIILIDPGHGFDDPGCTALLRRRSQKLLPACCKRSWRQGDGMWN